MSEYVILEADNPERLAELVTLRLRDGWRLAGGVATAMFALATSYGSIDMRWWYAQALTRDTDA